MPLTDYLRLTVLLDGVMQTEVSDIKVNGKSGAQAVELLRGLAGKTPGARQLEFSGTWAIPISGPEFDVVGFTADGSYHDLQIPLGPKTLISSGWFQDCEIGQSTGSHTQVSGTFMGEFNPPQ
jgi:hypothetical protein